MALWSELSSMQTHHARVWDRAIALSERLWNSEVEASHKKDLLSLRQRLIKQLRRMEERGIHSQPIANRICY